ncbi:2'-deoxycytidine 5'-triphosphate deaminase [Iamia sp. SCSIO 61187]|uniref:2'-deoxycytidine 5'-triphosphate deaminase n=1 Tax=Iamia sp. SCSIO 61187 TaxID=2722752 RepID=UPI001C629574|nr:2'-deoxycytidine 5'-triphosphate deaminase [Iamia sp. SCSIO 61187]QYG91323.1 2'-deoxycytidine 5'-triphosphate deaminase [Iamia sp. SCSIO 61187]
MAEDDWTAPGVLPYQDVLRAIDEGVVRARSPIPQANVQPASLDLRLGAEAHRMRCSFLPDRESVRSKLEDYRLETVDISAGAVLEPGRPYLIPLMERLELPATVRARANPKSSTGRVDVFTRVITDRNHRFDDIPAGYRGPLYLEVVSRTFAVRIQQGMSLNQLRMAVGETAVSDQQLIERHNVEPMVYDARSHKIPDGRMVVHDGLFLTLDLEGDDDGVVGYRARRNSQVLDLTQIGVHRVRDFWEPVFREHDEPRVVLEPDDFYLLISMEAVRIPATFASEMSAYAESAGELRSHYAGFFDPGFGHPTADGPPGSRAVLEVRARDVPFMVEQGQPVCKLTYETVRTPPTFLYGRDTGSNYQGQVAMLSKHFERDHSTLGQMSLLSEVR